MLSPAQMKAARALIEWDQRTLAKAAGVSLPTIQRMEASEQYVRANVDTLMKVLGAFDRGGVEVIAQGAVSAATGRGVRLK